MILILVGDSPQLSRHLVAALTRKAEVLMLTPEPAPPQLDPVEVLKTLAYTRCSYDLPETEVPVSHVFTEFMCAPRPGLPSPLVGGPESHLRKERDYG